MLSGWARWKVRKFPILRAGVSVFLVALAIGRAAAQESTESFNRAPPAPDEYDWVQLTSLEWIKGEIIAVYHEILVFDSEEFDLQRFDWEDVKELRPARPMEVALENDTIETGKIFIDEHTLRILGDLEREFPRTQIVSISTRALREIDAWAIKISWGANSRQGNTQQVETTGRAELIRRTAESRVGIDYLASFNETDGATAADNQRATMAWAHFESRRFIWAPTYGEWFRDLLQNIRSRWTVGAAIGYNLINNSKVSWEAFVGPAYQKTLFEDVAEEAPTSSETVALLTNTSYENELTSWLDLEVNYQASWVKKESGTYNHHPVTGIELDITSLLASTSVSSGTAFKILSRTRRGTSPSRTTTAWYSH